MKVLRVGEIEFGDTWLILPTAMFNFMPMMVDTLLYGSRKIKMWAANYLVYL